MQASIFIQWLWEQPQFYLTWVVVVMFSICLHEFCHAWVALTQGDTTARDSGRLSMNPMAVMGPQALIFLVLFGIAWGAVPINPRAYRRAWSRGLVAFAGPAANLVLAAAFTAGAWLGGEVSGVPLYFVCRIGLWANLFLFLFNMLPIPILDGWEVYACFIPRLRRIPGEKSRRAGFIALVIILFSGLHSYIGQAASVVADVLLGNPL